MEQKLIVEIPFNDIVLNIRPHKEYEWLLTTKEVAEGYGVNEDTILVHKKRHADELIEGKHYFSDNLSEKSKRGKGRPSTLWTKQGIVRLGFFIKSERAKLFRDWAEDLILNHLEQSKGNYITETRLEEILEENNTFLLSIMRDMADAVHILASRKIKNIENEISFLKTRLESLESHFSNKKRLKSTDRVAYVYVFRKIGTNEYKIGKSVNPLARKGQLEQGGVNLELVLSIEFKNEHLALIWEKTLQESFKHSWLKGEWYVLSDKQIVALFELAKVKEDLVL